MNIVFFTHPSFLGSQSMPRYAKWLSGGMESRGHKIELWSPEPVSYKMPVPGPLKKWMGYADQYIIFPAAVKKRIRDCGADTLFVFTDHALGPWVPLVADRPHVVHCHDFLAQRSAAGTIEENPTSWTGQRYQAYIRNGYRQAQNFISISGNTKQDLHQFLGFTPEVSEVVYNGLTQSFTPQQDVEVLRAQLAGQTGIDLAKGYLLHVGGNQWYKNRRGVVEIYDAWRSKTKQQLPLLLIGARPNRQLEERIASSIYKQDIHTLTGKDDAFVKKVYSGATVFIFPSLAEGFGWPIAEAMASGAPVITTEEAPMTEVAGNAAFLLPRMPRQMADIAAWAQNAASTVERITTMQPEERATVVAAGIANAERFDAALALNRIENIYRQILEKDN
ncbi:glycosyltransferase [Chitinophaga tropicalis]|uniref:Glycosyltransferase n=1 Tax=Chitinophaga tropicalis TaxID=2683588 RepID=A0A7K1UBJ8_9BACT|nr:glycosyltransferase [Chitinophaga tropicalis]MVT11723.1 glycosyltransferase [Chitinophaga tropicalis]